MTNQPTASEFSSQPDPQHIREINGRRFVLYAGLLELAERKELSSLEVEVLQFPSESNGNTAVCRAVAVLENGKRSVDIGEASAETLDPRVARFLFSMASTRAKGRALRGLCGVSMTCLEELGSFDDVVPAISDEVRTGHSTEPSPEHPTQQQPPSRTKSGPRSASPAQLRAIRNIAKSKKLTEDNLQQMCKDKFNAGVDALNIRDASSLIDHLKQAA